MTLRARLTLEPDQSVCLTSGYDRQFVDDLKRAIPWDGRSWDPSRKVWIVTPLYAAVLVQFLQQAGVDLQDDRAPAPVVPAGGELLPVPAMPADLKAAFDTLTLAYDAPLGLADVAFKFYSRYSTHADAGGSIDFYTLNDAVNTIRRYLDPQGPDDEIPF